MTRPHRPIFLDYASTTPVHPRVLEAVEVTELVREGVLQLGVARLLAVGHAVGRDREVDAVDLDVGVDDRAVARAVHVVDVDRRRDPGRRR